MRPKVLERLAQDLGIFQMLLSRLQQLPEACAGRSGDSMPDQPQLPLQRVLNACVDLLISFAPSDADKLQKAFGHACSDKPLETPQKLFGDKLEIESLNKVAFLVFKMTEKLNAARKPV